MDPKLQDCVEGKGRWDEEGGRECPKPGLADGWELQLLADTRAQPLHTQGAGGPAALPFPSRGLLPAPASRASWAGATREAVRQPACKQEAAVLLAPPAAQESVPTLAAAILPA